MNKIIELELSKYIKINKLTSDQIHLKLRCSIILLENVDPGSKIVFKLPDNQTIDAGYVPYGHNTLPRNVYTAQLTTKAPRLPPEPISIDIDEIELLFHKDNSPDPLDGGFDFANAPLAHLVDAVMMHLQILVHEGDPLKVRAPEGCRSSTPRHALAFLCSLAAFDMNSKYVCLILQLHMDYVSECTKIDRAFTHRLLEKHGFESDVDAYKHLFNVIWQFRSWYIHNDMRESHSQRVAMQVLKEMMFNHPKIVDAYNRSRGLDLWLANEYV